MGDVTRGTGRIVCISLWQPFASLVVMGPRVKPHETRSWSTRYRGPLLVHAARHRDAESDRNCLAASVALVAAGVPVPELYPLGAVVGACRLVSCGLIGGFFPAEPDHELDERFGDWSKGRYAWALDNALAFEPVPCVGSQGFWEPTPDVLSACVRNARVAARQKFDMAPEVAGHLIEQLFPDMNVPDQAIS